MTARCAAGIRPCAACAAPSRRLATLSLVLRRSGRNRGRAYVPRAFKPRDAGRHAAREPRRQRSSRTSRRPPEDASRAAPRSLTRRSAHRHQPRVAVPPSTVTARATAPTSTTGLSDDDHGRAHPARDDPGPGASHDQRLSPQGARDRSWRHPRSARWRRLSLASAGHLRLRLRPPPRSLRCPSTPPHARSMSLTVWPAAFEPESELSRLNASAGEWTAITPDLARSRRSWDPGR